MNIIFFGSSKHVIPIIETLRKNFDLACVVTTEKLSTDPVLSYCNANKILYLSVSNLSDPILKSSILNLKSQIAVLASFGAIIPSEILDIFPKGIINIHPSLLPKYRGPTPVQTAILNGDRITGVTIIKLDEEVDHGPILTQKEEPILKNDTAESLYDRLFKISAGSIVQTIELFLKGKIKLRQQNQAKATFTKKLTREDGYFDLKNSPSPQILDRMIRAYYPWPGAWSKFKVQPFDFVQGKNSKFKVVKFLPEKKIQVEGKKPVSYKDFFNGYPEAKKVIQPLIAVEK